MHGKVITLTRTQAGSHPDALRVSHEEVSHCYSMNELQAARNNHIIDLHNVHKSDPDNTTWILYQDAIEGTHASLLHRDGDSTFVTVYHDGCLAP